MKCHQYLDCLPANVFHNHVMSVITTPALLILIVPRCPGDLTSHPDSLVTIICCNLYFVVPLLLVSSRAQYF